MSAQTPSLAALQHVVDYGTAGKLGRLLKNPVDWLFAVFFKKVIYSNKQKPLIRRRKLFFGLPFYVPLPAATDIFLAGGKTHPSEVRLAAYMIQHLKPGQRVLDVGAHCGYFSALAAELVGKEGKVYSFEPSDLAHSVLAKNAVYYPQQKIFKQVVAETAGDKIFYEFPGSYAEYSSMDIEQYEGEPWLAANPSKKHQLSATSIDQLTAAEGIAFDFIKIDVEGAEEGVIRGAMHFCSVHSPVIALEYIHPDRSNRSHEVAASLLASLGYEAWLSDEEGRLHPAGDVPAFLKQSGLESENVIFKKGQAAP